MDKTELLAKIKENHETRGRFISVIEGRIIKGAETDATKKKFAKFLEVSVLELKKRDKTIYKELQEIIDQCTKVPIRKAIKDKVKRGEKVLDKEWEELFDKAFQQK